MNTILEMGSHKTKGGRRYIKMALLTIHENEEDTNLNGINWVEEYVLNNIDSVAGMPICCEFIDETKTIPLDHGCTGQVVDDNGVLIPIFENSEVVGTISKGQIETINIDGVDTKVLTGEGYLYNQRYPNFVQWVKENKDNIKSSIEISGTEENEGHIIYDGEATDEYRKPMVFSFSGTAILGVKEADKNAVILEAASLNKTNKNKESEVNIMDEKTINLICDSVKNAVSETNSKNGEYETKINELNASLADKDSKIVELNASVEQLTKAISDMEAERDAWWAEKDALTKQLGEALAAQRIGELNAAIAGFTDAQKEFAKSEIETFKADPVNVEINSVVDAIYRGIGKQSMEKKNEPVVEVNSANSDIYGEVFIAQANNTSNNEGSIY